ncbi:hypothetical protein GRI39_09650 [Altererythrobacter indicus]|uniref:Lipoprotein n=1 Tax=Altericroceibacterium indicum TaxID=374177 RepID=A0A845AAB5_9SPHN|nr:copper resistance protein NlpE [Altericroceibacterium indicum]MXP26299.1 hypothetical protein [Altericroceibacterium indicum]
MGRLCERAVLGAVLAMMLAGCGARDEGESANDFAARIKGESAASANASNQKKNAAVANLPQAAADGKKAVKFAEQYVPAGSDAKSQNGLTIRPDGTFALAENGKKVSGKYQWLPDGKRLRLIGVESRPIVLVANGALYRMTNENVPLDDVTPDRMYQLPAVEKP